MKSTTLLTTAAVAVLSSSTPVLGTKELLVDFTNYIYEPKEIDTNIAKGGLQKLINSGVFTLEPDARPHKENPKDMPKRGRRMARHGKHYKSGSGGGSSGGSRGQYYPQQEPKDHSYYEDPTQDDKYYYANPEKPGGTDDSLLAEEVVFLAAFQDNRFSSADPIFVTPNDPNPAATGNLWLYADVPLQEEGGIDVDPLLGFAQGTCQSIFEDQDGYCHFTYEFFDGLEVIASLTVAGETLPTGPSILTIVGGTGELKGATGEVSLTPVSVDDTSAPPSIVDDGATFLGNPSGYFMEAIIYVKYSIGDITTDDFTWTDDAWGTDDAMNMESPTSTPVVDDDAMDMESPTTTPIGDDDALVMESPTTTPVDSDDDAVGNESPPPSTTPPVLANESGGSVLSFGRVVCAGMDPDLDYCDCNFDCEDSPTHRCGCDEAWVSDCCGTAF
ncbi:hypothetical protein IV203_025949 [Nitzschia inconspicua]|uniref:Uncharacterized protein n=1 Tax=Nitzschia inconspicua TaxID=303405 RepID=A0A9K3P849_9STRA|nr:hypothetical protein IV203_017735 [Nitzschia inconspicua]KAG7362283.1 hypothetical protein IV203_025949 [Nitzschia inconspicua]